MTTILTLKEFKSIFQVFINISKHISRYLTYYRFRYTSCPKIIKISCIWDTTLMIYTSLHQIVTRRNIRWRDVIELAHIFWYIDLEVFDPNMILKEPLSAVERCLVENSIIRMVLQLWNHIILKHALAIISGYSFFSKNYGPIIPLEDIAHYMLTLGLYITFAVICLDSSYSIFWRCAYSQIRWHVK